MAVPSIKQAISLGMRLMFYGDFSMKYDSVPFKLSGLSLRKKINILIQGVQYFIQPLNRIGIPLILQLEPTNRCNLRCLTCATGAGLMKRPGTNMDFHTYQRIIDQTKNHVCLLAFWSWGEPFMNSEAFRMIRYAKQNGLLVHTSTNGHFISTRNMARNIVKSRLDSIVFAVDGLDESTYARYRRNGCFEKTIQAIQHLVEERKNTGSKTPFIVFRFIVMKHNEHQVSEVKSFASALGVDAVSLRSAVVARSDLDLADTLTPRASQYQQTFQMKRSETNNSGGIHHPICHRPYATLTIFSNGDVVLCENDFNATIVLGNVNSLSLHDILTSQKAKRYLHLFKRHLDELHFCRKCEFREMKGPTPNIETHVFRSGSESA